MGSGIAHAYLLAGHEVYLVEANNEASISARDRIKKLIQSSIDRGSDISLAEVSDRLTFLTKIDDLPTCRIAIEAVPEIPSLKNEVLGRLDSVLSKDAIIASNTSSISINELANSLRFPERFVGMHFFNPVRRWPIGLIIARRSGDANHAQTRWYLPLIFPCNQTWHFTIAMWTPVRKEYHHHCLLIGTWNY